MSSFTHKEKILNVLMHIFVWIFLFVLPSYFLYLESSDDRNVFLIGMIQTILFGFIFYMNYFLLIPYLFFRKKRIVYFISSALVVLISIVGMELMMSFYHRGPRGEIRKTEIGVPPPGQPGQGPHIEPDRYRGPRMIDQGSGRGKRPVKGWPVYNFLVTSVILTGFSVGLRYSEKFAQQERLNKEVEKARLNSELAFLKNQINPHFFFNTLNNIYSLVQINLKDGQKAILQLSKLMRYLLYETEKGNIRISQEIEFMNNYIELMKLRISKSVSLTINFPENYPDVLIPPLIFLPFLENAFKHGISYLNPSFINIDLEISQQEIKFRCRNSQGKRTEELFRSEPGIGLENVKKRLALLYPMKHDLKLHSSAESFEVLLSIELNGNTTG